jgi:hypothetical protein
MLTNAFLGNPISNASLIVLNLINVNGGAFMTVDIERKTLPPCSLKKGNTQEHLWKRLLSIK